VELPGNDRLVFAGDTDRLADEIEEFLTGHRAEPSPNRILATVMFTDIVDSTRHASELGDQRWRQILDRHDDLVRDELQRFGGREIKAIGDGFLAAFDGPARAVRCAEAIVGRAAAGAGLKVRAGVHVGECEARGDDLAGITVHVGSRVCDLAAPDEVLVTSTVRDLVAGSGLEFCDRGQHTLKGVPGTWSVLAVQP
jgi:class 3 adenylate cyclase